MCHTDPTKRKKNPLISLFFPPPPPSRPPWTAALVCSAKARLEVEAQTSISSLELPLLLKKADSCHSPRNVSLGEQCNCSHGPEPPRICHAPFTSRWISFSLHGPLQLSWVCSWLDKVFILEAFLENTAPCSLQKPCENTAHSPTIFRGFWGHTGAGPSRMASAASENQVQTGCTFKNNYCQVLVNAGGSAKTLWYTPFNICVMGLPSLP